MWEGSHVSGARPSLPSSEGIAPGAGGEERLTSWTAGQAHVPGGGTEPPWGQVKDGRFPVPGGDDEGENGREDPEEFLKHGSKLLLVLKSCCI